jgi:hypothetical protein
VIEYALLWRGPRRVAALLEARSVEAANIAFRDALDRFSADRSVEAFREVQRAGRALDEARRFASVDEAVLLQRPVDEPSHSGAMRAASSHEAPEDPAFDRQKPRDQQKSGDRSTTPPTKDDGNELIRFLPR